MGQQTDSFKIVYNSDLIIRDESEAATLCVFYDQVFLPYIDTASRTYMLSESGAEKKETQDYKRVIRNWEVKYGTLFDSRVLVRMAPFEGYYEDFEAVRRCEFYERPQGEGIPDDVLPRVMNGSPPSSWAWGDYRNCAPISDWGELRNDDKIVSTKDGVRQPLVSNKRLLRQLPF